MDLLNLLNCFLVVPDFLAILTVNLLSYPPLSGISFISMILFACWQKFQLHHQDLLRYGTQRTTRRERDHHFNELSIDRQKNTQRFSSDKKLKAIVFECCQTNDI